MMSNWLRTTCHPTEVSRWHVPLLAALLGCSSAHAQSGPANAEVHHDRDEWIAAVGGRDAFTTLDFTQFTMNTVMTDQYLSDGALFSDGNDIVWSNPGIFRQDGWGVVSSDSIWIDFCEPQRFVAIDFPSIAGVSLLYQGQGVATSGWLQYGFGGMISSAPFDRVVIWDSDTVAVDNIHFGRFPPVPGDTTFDDVVDIDDLINVIVHWGDCAVAADACPVPPCAHADLDGDGTVGVNDLVEVLVSWSTSAG